MNREELYHKLAVHLSSMYLGWLGRPPKEELIEILKEKFNEEEAEVLLSIPATTVPLELIELDEIASKTSLPQERLEAILERLSSRGLLFSGETVEGRKGYALLRSGYGFPQTFHWKRQHDPHAKRMAELLWKYHFPKVKDARVSRRPPNYRYVPVNKSIDIQQQAIYPFEMMEEIVRRAEKIAVAHCPCRMKFELVSGKSCGHPLEVCLKFDEMAEYLIRGRIGKRSQQGRSVRHHQEI